MPNTTITDLVSGSSATGAVIPADQAGSTVKVTPAQILTAANGEVRPTIVAEAGTNFGIAVHGDRAVIRCTAGTAVTVSVDEQAVGYRAMVVQEGAGQVTLDPDGTTFVFDSTTFDPATAAQGSAVELLWLTATTVLILGDLALA